MDILAALAWDPQIRGFLIVFVSLVMLPGSIYLLLATNVGARLGFLLAAAGLTGWMFLLSITWVIYGQGMKGRDPSWKVQEVVHSASSTNLEDGALKVLNDFPKGWTKLPLAGDKILADAQAATDNFVTKSGRKPKMGHEGLIIKEPTPAQLRYPAEFGTADEYVLVGGFRQGGDNELFTIGGHKFYFRHSPHYVTVAIQPKLEGIPVGQPAQPDPDQEITTVVLLRDLGSIRFPSFMILVGSGLTFAVVCHALHRRDKQIMALRAAGVAPATA